MSQCPRCHQPLPENARFCGNCGYRVPGPGEGVAAPAPEPVAGAPAPCPEGAPRSGAGDPAAVAPEFAGRTAAAARASRKGRTGRILALVLGAAAVAAVVCGAFLFAQDSKAKEPHPIAVGVSSSTTSQGVDAGTAQSAWGIQVATASGAAYDDGATSIPVKVDGTVDGASYETVSYLDAEGAGLALPVGDFTLTFPAGAILSDGTFVAPADDTQVTVTVEDTDQGPHATFSQDVTFTEVPASQVTDDDLDAVARYAQDDANDQGKAQDLCQNVRDARESQASTAQAAKKAYAAWLTQYAVPWGDSGKTVASGALSFCLVDANNDGIPDLMLDSNANTAHGEGYMELLTYVDGDVKMIDTSEEFTVYTSGYVLSSFMGSGDHVGTYFTFDGATVKEHAHYAAMDEDLYDQWYPGKEPVHRDSNIDIDHFNEYSFGLCVTDVSVDGKAVDWDTYNAAVTAITQEEVPLSMVDNTAANRTSVLLKG